MCNKQLLRNQQSFPDSLFWGSGDPDNRYARARITDKGWCASGSVTYLSLNLRNEYHITDIFVMGDKEQTKWSSSYLLSYSHDTSYQHSKKVFKVMIALRYFLYCLYEKQLIRHIIFVPVESSCSSSTLCANNFLSAWKSSLNLVTFHAVAKPV